MQITLESPAGLIKVKAECRDGKVKKVSLRNVPCFPVHLDKEITVPEIGKVTGEICAKSSETTLYSLPTNRVGFIYFSIIKKNFADRIATFLSAPIS